MTAKDKALELYNEICREDLRTFSCEGQSESGLSLRAAKRIEGAIREARNEGLREAARAARERAEGSHTLRERADYNDRIIHGYAAREAVMIAQAIEQMIEEG
jgi:hypothetical protein